MIRVLNPELFPLWIIIGWIQNFKKFMGSNETVESTITLILAVAAVPDEALGNMNPIKQWRAKNPSKDSFM